MFSLKFAKISFSFHCVGVKHPTEAPGGWRLWDSSVDKPCIALEAGAERSSVDRCVCMGWGDPVYTRCVNVCL